MSIRQAIIKALAIIAIFIVLGLIGLGIEMLATGNKITGSTTFLMP